MLRLLISNQKNSCAKWLVGCWRWLILAGIPEYEESPLLVCDVDVASSIHEDIFGLIHKCPYGNRRNTLCRSGGNKPTGFCHQMWIFDIKDTKPCIEIGGIDQIAGFFHVRQMVFEIGVVRAETTSLAAEITVRSVLWRDGSRQ